MRTLVSVAIAAIFASSAAAQGVSVIVRPAQELPVPAVQPETIPTPAPNEYGQPYPAPPVVQVQVAQPPAPWVMERRAMAVPVVRWGFFGRLLVPRTLIVQVWRARPARVTGPYYYYR